MKRKIVVLIGCLLGATAFTQEASAVPAFARQMGMACSSCHFQHFPLLNSFGCAFKASGFTMIGMQTKVEDENLSIPSTLNFAGFATAGYSRVSNQPPGTSVGSFSTPNGGGELSLFFGGRVSENVGFLSELAFPDSNSAGSAAKLVMTWDVAGTRTGLSIIANKTPAYSMELLNTGAVETHKMVGDKGDPSVVNLESAGIHSNVFSAAQYLGTGAPAHGGSFVSSGSMGFVNIGKYNLNPVGGSSSQSSEMSTTYARAAYIFELAGWDTAVGVQNFSGHVGNSNNPVGLFDPAAPTPAGYTDSKATIIDGQLQGEIAGKLVGVYASCGRAPISSTSNLYNIHNETTKRSCNIAGELGIIPHKATAQLAFRSARNGDLAGRNTDNAVMLGGTYELSQNVELSLTHTMNSGNAYDAAAPAVGKTQTTLLLEALF